MFAGKQRLIFPENCTCCKIIFSADNINYGEKLKENIGKLSYDKRNTLLEYLLQPSKKERNRALISTLNSNYILNPKLA